MFEEMKAELENRLNKKIIVKEITKGVITRLAFVIGDAEDKIGAVIYPEDWLDSSIDERVEFINKAEDKRVEISNRLNDIADFEKMKSKLMLCVGPQTEDMHIVKKPFLDVSLYVRINFDDEYTVRVRDDLVKSWNITEDEVFEIAKANMNYKIVQLSDEAYIVTTKDILYGASAITNNEILNDVRGILKDDLLIIPSSIHELIIVPLKSSNVKDTDEVLSFVKMMNEEHLAPEEVLSNNIYIYNGECRIAS